MTVENWPPCDVCEKPVETPEGVLALRRDELARCSTARKRWETENRLLRQVPEAGTIETMGFVSSRPERARWDWGHGECLSLQWPPTDEDDRVYEYEIPANRFDTPKKALDWTLHIMFKGFFRDSDWDGAVRRLHNVPGGYA